MTDLTLRDHRNGFTLIELLITIMIIGILVAIAMPTYNQYLIRASRQAAQADMVQMANTQEKIYLNSNAYTGSITNPYNGNSAVSYGLGRLSTSLDGNYTYTLTPVTPSQFYTLTATPVAGTRQANDGTLTLSSNGLRTWGTTTW
jgi:type IV pilus assembly protein PilE